MGQTYLTVQITDADGDLTATAYAAGTLTAEQFQGGRNGQSFTVGRNGIVTFSVYSSGTYTFYAVDSAGNETVQTISVTVSTQESPMQGGRMGNMPVSTPSHMWWQYP